MSTFPRFWKVLSIVAVIVATLPHGDAFMNSAFRKFETDYHALTTRVTTRHILVPNERVARVLKQKIRDECVEKDLWVVDAFESAAKKYSMDESTSFRGGLIGELVPQGYYSQSRELDRLQFSVSLGNIVGPVETEHGHHLMLVSERTNMPALDGDYTRMTQARSNDVFGTLSEGEQVGRFDLSNFIEGQLQFWTVATVATGMLAEVLDNLAPAVPPGLWSTQQFRKERGLLIV